jgi:hypothetical protein
MGYTKRWVCILAVILMMPSGVCLAQDQDESVRRRLREMKSDDDPAQVAEMELIAMGDKAVVPLKKIIDDAKDSERAEAIRIYPAVLEKAGLLTRVSLDLNDAPIKEAIAALNAQASGDLFEINSSMSSRRMTIRREKVPYALALAEICQKTDTDLHSQYATRKVTLFDSPGSRNRPVLEDWGTVMLIDQIIWEGRVVYGEGAVRSPKLTVVLEELVDPKRRMIFGGYFKNIVATGENGEKVEFTNAGQPEADQMPWSIAKQYGLAFKPDRNLTKLSRLSGEMMEYDGYDLETWTISDPSKAAGLTHEFGPIKMKILTATVRTGVCRIEGSWTGIPRPTIDEGNQYQSMTLFQLGRHGFMAESDDGKGVWSTPGASVSTGGLAEDSSYRGNFEVEFTNTRGQPGKGLSVKATMPRKFIEAWTKFDFKDIELP